jgi:competence protein ComEC
MGRTELDQAQGQDEPDVARLRFRRAPLAAAALWLAVGIAAARWSSPPTVVLVAGLALLATIAAASLRTRVGWVPVAGLWVAVGMAAAMWQPGPPGAGPIAAYADGLSRTVRGRVTRVRVLAAPASLGEDDTPELGEEAEEDLAAASGRTVSVDLALEAVERVTPDVSEMVPVQGGVRAFVYPGPGTAVPAPGCGDVVEMAIRLKMPERYRDPGAWQYADYLLGQGIAAQGSAKAVRRVGRAKGWSWERAACGVHAAQTWAAGRMERYTGSRANRLLPGAMRLREADAAMLNAMLFGDRTGLNHRLRVGFERTGSFHLFVVSGLHVALLAAGVFWTLRRMRVAGWLATAATLGIASAYAVLTGFGQPVQRALAMTALYLLARLIWRQGDSLNSLGAAALAMLVWTPSSLFDASFQMTVLAIVAIAGIAGPLGEWSFLRYARAAKDVFGVVKGLTPGEAELRVMLQVWGEAFEAVFGRWARGIPAAAARVALWGLELALIGTVAELVMVLPMALYFHRAAVFALPANMIVIPLIAALAPAGVATFAASLVSPWAAVLPGAVTALLLHGIQAAIARLGGLAVADVRVPGPAWWVAGVALAGWIGCCWAVRRGRWGAWLTVGALPVIAALVLWPEPVHRTRGALEVTALDVGQGDSLLIVGPDGKTMLIDAGGPVGRAGRMLTESGAGAGFDVGEEVVSPYLWSRQVRRLDVVALTHAHSDHMGGMPAVLRNFRPKELWVGIDPGSAGYIALLAEARTLGIRVRHLHAGEGVAWGEVKVKALSPDAAYRNAGAAKNDDSLVMRLDFGAASALLEGDAERMSERTMLAHGEVAPVTLLKVAHHGSITSSAADFLAAARPKEAVISVGAGNPFGHPRMEIIRRFADAGVRLYRTDEFGLTTFLLGRDGAITEVSSDSH